jgi:hypothetical protein
VALLTIGFLLIFFWERLPLFSLGWDGQDASGHDADIFFHQPAFPDFILFGRLRGYEIYMPAYGHPAPLYEMFKLLGKAVALVVPYQSFSDGQVIALLKVIASLLQLIIWLPLLWLMLRNGPKRITRLVGCVVVIGFALCPLSVQGSNEFQIDSTIGFVAVGLYTFALWFAARNKRYSFFGAIAIVAASIFIGLGKNEWTLVLVIACGCLLVIGLVLRVIGKSNERQMRNILICVGATILGLEIGNLLSFLYEPIHYASGWNLLTQMIGSSSVASNAGRSRFIEINLERLPFTQVLIFVILFLTLQVVLKRPPVSIWLTLGSVYGLGLFAAFFISTWGPFPRYFAPGFAVLSIIMVWFYVEQIEQPLSPAALLICALASCWFAIDGVQFAQSDELANRSIYGIRKNIEPRIDCALLLPVEDAYRRKDLDFAHAGYGYDGAEQIMQRYGGHVCRPD